MTPMPRACAMATAMRATATVSIAEATLGMFKGPEASNSASARMSGRRAMPADRVNHLSMHPLFPFHMNCDHRMRRRHQQQRVENQPEDQANDDQDQIENRGKWLPVQEQPKRRY